MKLSDSAKRKMEFLSAKKVHEHNRNDIGVSLETFYKALQGREFSVNCIEAIEQAIDETIKLLYGMVKI